MTSPQPRRAWGEGWIAVPPDAPRPPSRGPAADRAFTANVLGTLALTVVDRVSLGAARATRHGANGPAALVTLLWYPDRPIAFLAARLRISHPGAVQLVDRLERDGLVERVPAADGRTKLLALTAVGEDAALAVLAARRDVLDRAVSALDDDQVLALADAAGAMLEALADTLLTSEFMCRMCDELACPDARCPVERAEPSPPHRRGSGYGVPARD
ncbi:MAG: MarR family transcriptional regulator [Frankiales bacterium]|nr:MarR family transcriptional regulator [Frankiales bacterium]